MSLILCPICGEDEFDCECPPPDEEAGGAPPHVTESRKRRCTCLLGFGGFTIGRPCAVCRDELPASDMRETDCEPRISRCGISSNAENVRADRTTGEVSKTEKPCAKIFDHKWLDPECVETGCQSLFLKRLLSASSSVVQLIEGFPGYGCSVNANGRLKDQASWVEFYVLVKDLEAAARLPLSQGAQNDSFC